MRSMYMHGTMMRRWLQGQWIHDFSYVKCHKCSGWVIADKLAMRIHAMLHVAQGDVVTPQAKGKRKAIHVT